MGSMFLLTAAIAMLISIAIAWPSYGALIGPALLVGSLAVALITAWVRHPRGVTAFRMALAIFLTVVCLYLSIGPASWLMARYIAPSPKAPVLVQRWYGNAYSYLYRPIATNAIFAPKPVRQISFDYMRWWMPDSVEFHDMGGGMGWSVRPGWYTIISYPGSV